MDDIIIGQTYPYPIEYVWEALTDPAALSEWLMPGDFKPIVGHTLQFHCDPRPEFDGTVHVEILEVDKPRRLSYSWKTGDIKKPTVVTEEDLIVGGEKVVERSSAVATHRASLMAEQPTNKQVRWTEIHIYQLRDGTVVPR